jgi:hypothetical protein
MGGRRLLTMAVCSAFIALPSTGKAESWTEWFYGGNFKSYGECLESYTKHPLAWWHAPSPEDICTRLAAAQDETRREKEKTYRIIVLSCRADSVSEEQFAACVALATGR